MMDAVTLDPAWAELEYPLSLRELQRLGDLRQTMLARMHIGLIQERVEMSEAQRLAFARHLFASRRISG